MCDRELPSLVDKCVKVKGIWMAPVKGIDDETWYWVPLKGGEVELDDQDMLGEELFDPKVEAGGIVSFGTCSELKWQPEFTSDGWAKMPHSVVVNREQGW